jgi:hypothetical protein
MNPEDATPYSVVLESNHLFMLGRTANDIFRYRHGAWRNPLDYADQPLTGTVQCGDDGSAQNPVAECGEEPPDQISLDSAVCNRFLANEVWYLVNDTLTNEAPPKISELAYPNDSLFWGNYWYIGGDQTGSTINELEVDEYDRQRLEKLCLKHGPTNAWIVTVFDIWRTTPLGEWVYEDAGDTFDVGEWQFTTGTTTPLKITAVDNNGVSWATEFALMDAGNSLRFEKPNGEWIEYVTTLSGSVQAGPPAHYSFPINTTPKGQSSDWSGLTGLMQVYLRESI